MAASIGAPPAQRAFHGAVSRLYSFPPLASVCKGIPANYGKASIGIPLQLRLAPDRLDIFLCVLSPVSLSCPRRVKGGLLRMADGGAPGYAPHPFLLILPFPTPTFLYFRFILSRRVDCA